jgi:hypothetical protein
MRKNAPHGRIAQLRQLLLDPRTADWTDDDYANCLCTSVRSIERWRHWLRKHGYLPPLEIGGSLKRLVG